MANKTTHRGIIKPTVPNPRIFWGSVQEIADHCGIGYRSALLIFQFDGRETRNGYRAMTEEEQKKHYQPPKYKEPKKSKRGKYGSRLCWKITFFKDWKKGEKYPDPDDSSLRFTGSPQDFCAFVECNQGMVYRLLNTHMKVPENNKLKSIKGWTIARIRKYDL